ncbi:MAG: peptidylprolyl isomerase [Bacilli bacterium]|nr:peptidylprolyl isomerase [Bacilli bacterium]
MKKIIVLSMCGLLLLTGCGKTIPVLENGKEVVAELDGKQITTEELYDQLKEDGGTTAVVNMIDEYIMSQEFDDEDAAKSYADTQYSYLKAQYEASGEDLDTAILQYYASVQEFKDMIIKDYKSTQVARKYYEENLTDDEINEYYDDNIYGAMTVRHILIIPDTTDDMTDDEKAAAKATALTTAKDLITKLNNGADFAELAKENSADSTASNGGLFENFKKENTDAAFWQASYNLKDGEYTKTPVESAYGYHVILKVSSEDKPSLEDSKDTIVDALVDEKMDEDNAVDLAWIKIREKYNLNIVDSDIEGEYKDTIGTIQ